MLLINHLEETGILSPDRLAVLTNRDPVLSRVTRCIQMGWPNKPDNTLKPFAMRQTELYIVKNVMMWGTRVVISETARKAILKELHSCHFGIVKMKVLARSAVWWPGIDRDIEKMAAQCYICRVHNPNSPREELHPWQYLQRSRSRLHIDFAGPKKRKYFLVVVDAHSKWI